MIKNNDIRSLIDDSDYEEATSLLKNPNLHMRD